MANSVIKHHSDQQVASSSTTPKPNNALTMSGISFFGNYDLKHSIFSAHIVNRTTFNGDTWVIDTGATDHIVRSVHLFAKFTTVSCVVALPNGETATVTHIGSITLSSTLILHNVLCVHSFSFNLLSVSKHTKSCSCCLVFLSNFYFIQDLLCWRTTGVGEVHDGLYLLQHSPSDACTFPINSKVLGSFQSIFNLIFKSVFSQPQSHVLNNTIVPSSIWHLRLGHPLNAKLSSLKNVLHDSVCTFNKDCEICPLAKHKRLPFPFPNHISNSPFDIVHCDIWGPYPRGNGELNTSYPTSNKSVGIIDVTREVREELFN